MPSRIGVISPSFPPRCLKTSNALNPSVFWFSEIEACFAFLLNNMLDKVYIDSTHADINHTCITKYQLMIKQLHPHLEIIFRDFNTSLAHKNINYFYLPKLETLFKDGKLKSLFQPIVKRVGDTTKVYGFECLSRFLYNEHHYPPELIFNYAAEKLKLTNYDKICLAQSINLAPKHKDIAIFVNVRPQTLIAKDFCQWFKDLLSSNYLAPEQVVVEITEQYCNISEMELVDKCATLTKMGFKIAIDDYGSGLSNLHMLELIKPHYIKVSGRFTKNCHEDVVRQKIIKNVLTLVNDFNIKAVVESVETVDEWQMLKEYNAELGQGYYFYRPIEKAKLEKILFTNHKNKQKASVLVS